MTKINYYKTNLGIFLERASLGYYANLESHKINGKKIAEWAVGDKASKWVFLKDVHSIDSIEEKVAAKNTKIGYELKIASLESPEIPLTLSVADVNEFTDDDGDDEWRFYSDYQALYKPVYETSPEAWKPVDYELCLLREIQVDNYEAPQKMAVTMTEGNYGGKPFTYDLSSVVTYSDIEQMLTPEFMLHERPCSLSSQQVYKIVRNHIKNNIVNTVAEITSDYDFCFTVKRKVAVKPYVKKNEQLKNNGKSYHPPRFSSQSITHNSVEIFEMTDAKAKYGKYSVIQGWEANSLRDMKEQMERYLQELMDEINKPVAQCTHCNGTGHVHTEKIGTNNGR